MMINDKTSKENVAMIRRLHIALSRTINGVTKTLTDCVECGFVFIRGGVVQDWIDEAMFTDAYLGIGISARDANKTFHKSFSTVEKAEMDDLISQQLLHYFSTYGMESMGMKAMPMIPSEELELPIAAPKYITCIDIVDEFTAVQKITNYFCKVKKPTYEIIDDFETLIDFVDIAPAEVDQLSSYELQAIYCRNRNCVPNNPISFLRFVVYMATNTSMLNNSVRNCNLIKAYGNFGKYNEIHNYFEKADLTRLAEIFFRYKNIFLAFKKYPQCAPIINKIRRLADTYHKPLSDVSLQNFWQIALKGRTADMMTILKKADFFDLVKLFNIGALRLSADDWYAGVFNIRNGRTFVKDNFVQPLGKSEMAQYESILRVLAEEMKSKVSLEGKTFYVPSHIRYAAPVSEKQFIGNIPWGTRMIIPTEKAFTFGIAWDNQDNQRVDLDLHMHSSDGGTYGWNGFYRSTVNNESRILFTGDQTDAKNGAAEAFYFKPIEDLIYSLDVSQYSGPAKTPFKLFITETMPENKEERYTFNPLDVLMPTIPIYMNTNNDCGNTMDIGFVKNNEFVFYGGSLSNSIGGGSEYYEKYLDSQVFKCKNMLSLDDLIILLGGRVIYDIPADADMTKITNLSPEALTAETLTDLFRG